MSDFLLIEVVKFCINFWKIFAKNWGQDICKILNVCNIWGGRGKICKIRWGGSICILPQKEMMLIGSGKTRIFDKIWSAWPRSSVAAKRNVQYIAMQDPCVHQLLRGTVLTYHRIFCLGQNLECCSTNQNLCMRVCNGYLCWHMQKIGTDHYPTKFAKNQSFAIFGLFLIQSKFLWKLVCYGYYCWPM